MRRRTLPQSSGIASDVGCQRYFARYGAAPDRTRGPSSGIFDRVLIPQAVEGELLRFHPSLPDYLKVHAIHDQQAAESLSQELDRGEAEAIVLAEECHADYLLMDEKHGRSMAEARGLTVIGLLGVLLMAETLETHSGCGPAHGRIGVPGGVLRIRSGEADHFGGGRGNPVTGFSISVPNL